MDQPTEKMKKNAALRAVEMVEDGMILGLGSGSTVLHFLKFLSARIGEEELDVTGIPTSKQTERVARELGIPLGTLQDYPEIDLDVDGADEVDPELNVIKGGGGAHVREKIVAKASRSLVIIVDETKLSLKLGCKGPVPLEVVPMAVPVVAREVESMGVSSTLRGSNDNPFVTDNGNYIIDCKFPGIDDPPEVERRLKLITGVVDSGIFSDMVDAVVVGTLHGSEVRRASH